MKEKLLEAIRFFTRETQIMDGLTVVCGRRTAEGGFLSASAGEGRDIGERTLYDLASVTKIFTGLCLMRLREEGKLDFSRRVTDYAPWFSHLGAVTVEQLAAFQVLLKTPERIDRMPSPDQARQCLWETTCLGAPEGRAYSDIPAMVLKYVIEAAADEPFFECVRRRVLEPAGLTETFAKVPEDRIGDCLLYGPEYRIEGERWICRTDLRRGVPHDQKAAAIQGRGGDLCGHAGLFSTAADLEKLAQALLSGRILRPESLAALAVNRTGRQKPDGTYTQYLGYLCYLKHPDQYFSEIPAYMSPAAFGIGGFTGNHFSVDPATGRYTVFLGNRVRDRLTVLLPEAGKRRTDYGLQPDGRGGIQWTDGEWHPSSVDYVHQKDAHLHAVIETLFP